jgi:hypothetical protein
MPVCIKASTVSARSFLQSYVSNEEESSLEDPITMLNQNELFLESRSGLNDWCITNIGDLLIEIPCICRTMTVKMDQSSNRHSRLTSSVWFGRVIELPSIIKCINSADFLVKFKNKVIGRECINAAMLLTNRPCCNILNTGAGKHLSTFLLTGREDIFCADADLSAWAMVVVYICCQKHVASWMEKELSMIRKLEMCVYGSSFQASNLWCQYRDNVRSENFRLSLITYDRSLPKYLQCPHLNKYLLAIFVVAPDLTDAELEDRRNFLLVELYSRQCNTHFPVNDSIELLISKMFSMNNIELQPTIFDTVIKYKTKMEKTNFRDVEIIPSKLFSGLIINEKHWHLNCDAICNFFKFLRPSIKPLDQETWVKLFLMGYLYSNNLVRNTATTVSSEAVVQKLRSHLRRQLFLRLPTHVLTVFNAEMTRLHQELPMIFSVENVQRFDQKYKCDLAAEFALNKNGFSKNTCMCKQCPFFGQHIFTGNFDENDLFIQKGTISQHTLAINNLVFETLLKNKTKTREEILFSVINGTIELINSCPLHVFPDYETYFGLPYVNYLRSNSYISHDNGVRRLMTQTLGDLVLKKIDEASMPVPWERFEAVISSARATQAQRDHL